MKNIKKAYHEFWSSFSNRSTLLDAPAKIPAFPTDEVVFRNAAGKPISPPQDFKYITYDVVRPEFAGYTITTASVWDRNPQNPGFTGFIDDVLGQIAKVIPESGKILYIDNVEGAIWLLRNNPNFISYLTEPADQAVSRGLVSMFVKGYMY